MSLSRRLARALAIIGLLAAGSVVSGMGPARSAPAPGLCAMDTTRGQVPANFAIDACLNSSRLVLHNTLLVPVNLSLSGDTGQRTHVSINYSIPAELTRAAYTDPLLLLPGDIMLIPLGSGTANISIAGTEGGGFYALATALSAFIPAGMIKAAWGPITTMINELNSDFGKYANCLVGKNWLGQLGCRALLVRNVTFAVGRAVVSTVATGVVSLLLKTATFLKWAAAQPSAIGKIIHGNRTITAAALHKPSTNPSPGPSGGGGGGGQGTPPGHGGGGSNPTVRLSQGPPAPSGYRYSISLTGFAADANVSVTCYDSVSTNGFYSFSLRTNGSGNASTSSECYSGDGPEHWVVANGVASNHVTWSGGSPGQPSPTPAATRSEQEGHHGANTFTDYHNASGMGPRIGVGQWVQVSCKVYDPTIQSASPDGYWYRIQSSPWNNAYYAVANTFMNGDPWDGPYTHNTDFSVPNC